MGAVGRRGTETSTSAIELSALSEDELPGLIAYLAAGRRLPFRYVSVHAPVKNRKLDDSAIAQALRDLPLGVRSIITHPDTLNELASYRGLGTRLVVENMDDRKTTGRTADELAPGFDELPLAGFCLDVAHILRSIRRWQPAMSSLTDSAHDCARCT